MPTPFFTYSLLAIGLASGLGSAQAHVTLQDPLAASGTSYRAVLRVGHGCDGSATTRLTVLIPDGFTAAQPLVKPGWTLSTRIGTLAEPYEMHGTRYTEGVQEITWTAKGPDQALPDAFGDEFVFRGTTPKKPGTLWFKVLQACEKGRLAWDEVPATGDATHGLKSPAARLQILDMSSSPEHHH